jgi:hypothetical protein
MQDAGGRDIVELFKLLPSLLNLGSGHARVNARFREGRLHLTLRVSEFKIKPDAVGSLDMRDIAGVSTDAHAALERIALLLHRDIGDTELVAEYEHKQLKSFDRIAEFDLEVPVPTE